MSNSLAIAAVTSTLARRLDRGLGQAVPGTRVTTRPPDRARDGAAGNQVNLFLYQVAPNPSWRNALANPGGGRLPPVALNLYYLLSVYGEGEDDPDPVSHRLLGEAMRILHEQPVLDPAEVGESADGAGLRDQPERVRVTLQPLPLDEVSKMWTMFQTPYRLSVAYEVSVVLIDRGPGGV